MDGRSDENEKPQSNQSVKELIDISRMVGHGFLHPIESFQTFAPSLNRLSLGLVGKTFSPETDTPDLAGKIIFVTGGNTGLGKETILQLAKHNPSRIYLAARSEEKARDAISSINSELSSPVDIRHVSLDLASFKSIRAAAKKFTSESDQLDLLVLNAGIMGSPPDKTETGHEIQLGTNHLGHFLLAKLLLPTLRKTAASASSPAPDVRVVTVTSVGYVTTPPMSTITSTPALLAESTWARYGASKAANMLFASELARRHPEIMSVSVHPGLIATDLFAPTKKEGIPIIRCALGMFGPLVMENVQSGALNHLWAASAGREQLTNGGYYVPVGKLVDTRYTGDVDMGKRLWEWSDKEVGEENIES